MAKLGEGDARWIVQVLQTLLIAGSI